MALFAAYAEQVRELDENYKTVHEPTWLKNSSFKIDISQNLNIEDETVSNSISPVNRRSKSVRVTRKKKQKNKRRKCINVKVDSGILNECNQNLNNFDSNSFLIDTRGTRDYFQVDTISKPAVAKYHTKYHLTQKRNFRRNKTKRYFKNVWELKRSTEKPLLKLSKVDLNQPNVPERVEHFSCLSEEKKLSEQTAFFNKKLIENPKDIKLWLDYVNFQNSIYQFERSYRKGSIAKAQRVLAERKMAILDKAIEQNCESDMLLRERLKVTVNAYPSDELQLELKKLVDKKQDNIVLWQAYIEATQCSMAHCNTTSVISLYTKCLTSFNKLRRIEKKVLEEGILRMLYQCGLFLKQTGLFEKLWCLINLYLEVTLSPENKNKFDCGKYFNEKELLELEEAVFSSQLPHHELWLRVEKLRESCHWLPFVVDGEEKEECVDPQRIVFTDDVAELIHPITMPQNIFQLIATVFTLLKIPLIPCRHITIQNLGIDYVTWSLDSVENLLSMFMPLYPIDTFNNNLFSEASRFTLGPQYLRTLPGQDEYLDFVLSLMEKCANCLKETDQIAVRIWWFRFQRLLIILDKQHHFKMHTKLKKRIKSSIKSLLNKDNHRNNKIYYSEYALIEKEFGNLQKCIQILETTITSKTMEFDLSKYNQQKIQDKNHCFLTRIMVEVLLSQNVENKLNEKNASKNKMLIYLVRLSLQRDVKTISNDLLVEAETKFNVITNQIVQDEMTMLTPGEHFLPNFLVDWIICNCWFIYLCKGIMEATFCIESILKQLESTHRQSSSLEIEVINELYCALLAKHCLENSDSGLYKTLKEALLKSVEKYPNNLYILTLLASMQTNLKSLGIGWWNVETLLINSDRTIPILFTVIICESVKVEKEKQMKDSITGNIIELQSYNNRMLSLFKKITGKDMCTRRCGLIWRLYLQFAYNHFTPDICKTIYYIAVEECPWLKALYMDAAIYVPGGFAQIQDLIIEKELRLHVTPEELEILKD